MNLHFEWDDDKAASNEFKHGVTFNEASTAFRDALASVFQDLDRSGDEPREILAGLSDRMRLLMVCFVLRDGTIRLITARQATASERRRHESYLPKGWGDAGRDARRI